MMVLKLRCGTEITHCIKKQRLQSKQVHLLEIIDNMNSGTIKKAYANDRGYDDITYVQLAIVPETIPKVIKFLQKIQEDYIGLDAEPILEDD